MWMCLENMRELDMCLLSAARTFLKPTADLREVNVSFHAVSNQLILTILPADTFGVVSAVVAVSDPTGVAKQGVLKFRSGPC